MMPISYRFILAAGAVAAASVGLAQFDGPAPLAWRWSESTSASPSGQPAIDGEKVIVGVGGRIYCLDRDTGNLVWRYPSGEPLSGNFRTGVVMSGRTVVAASDQRVVYAINADNGQIIWQHTSSDPIIGSPATAGSAVAFPTASGQIVGLGLSDGQPLWGGPVKLNDRVLPNLAGTTTGIVAMTARSMVTLDANTGRPRWTQAFGTISSLTKPVVYGDTIYLTSGTFVIGLRAATGSVRWQQNTLEPLIPGVAAGPEGVIAVGQAQKIFTFDISGRPTSRRGFPISIKPGGVPSWAGKFALVPSAGGTLLMVDPRTGDTVWSYTIPAISRTSSSGSAGGGALSGGDGPSVGGGRGGGGGAAPGAGGGGQQADAPSTVATAGPAVVTGTSLMVLAQDGSLLSFDKVFGIDLTAPTVKMLWPTAGDQVSPNPPAELVFKIEDFTSGINPESVKVTLNGQEAFLTPDKDGIYRLLVVAGSRNRSLPIGRLSIKVTAADWLGNTSETTFVLLVDPAIDRPLGGPRPPAGAAGGGGGMAGGG